MRRMGLTVALALAPCAVLAHSWYEGLVDPYGNMCCNGLDCRPVDMCRTRRGEPGVQINRLCVEIPWNRVLATPAPDGRAHACWHRVWPEPTPIIRCVILPGEA